MTIIDPPHVEIERDRWGRPLITPPQGGKRRAYTRCTTFVDVLDDKYNLQQWQQRMVAIGLADRPDLLLSVSAHRGDKKELNRITADAREAAAAGAAATTGTALHKLIEILDRGDPMPLVPAAYQADIEAYRAATECLESVLIEQMHVHDEYEIGGTPDRIVRHNGRLYVADIKTGSIDYGALKIAMQLAVYANSTPYDIATGRRQPLDEPVDTQRAIVIHLPAGQGKCTLHWVDIDRGWRAVETAAYVRQWRRLKDWLTPLDPTEGKHAPAWRTEIDSATSVEQLRTIYGSAVANGADPDMVEQLCRRRIEKLESL